MIKQRSLLTLILLSIITCGIYSIVFWYQYADDMNRICQGDGKETKNYIVVLLLSFITFGIYGWIWYYNIGNRLSENAPRYGTNFDENGTTIILWMVIGTVTCGIGALIAMNILINNMNELGNRFNQQYYGGGMYQQSQDNYNQQSQNQQYSTYNQQQPQNPPYNNQQPPQLPPYNNN